MNQLSTKAQLRQDILSARRALPAADLAAQSAQLAERFFALPAWQQATAVGLFASAADEVATDAIILQALQDGKRVALPRVVNPPNPSFQGGKREAQGGLMWHAITSLDDLEVGSYGIREPRADLPAVDLSALALLLVPGVAFDTAGNRLGYGGGFYDRALARFAGSTVSLVLPCQLVKKIPMDDWDQSIDCVLYHEL